jgi:hypothetical protein
MPVLRPGTRLGPYEVLVLIGAGGMGEVYKARDTRLDRTVAIKILPPELAGDPERRQRFEREARTISALNHPHICTLHDVGEQDGTAFLVMEHLEGDTLAERLRRGALPLPQVLDYAAQIADGLAAAHRQGIVHRDLKPGNVMLTKTGIKLLDFGLAKLRGDGDRLVADTLVSAATQSEPLTGQGTMLGTLPYMAPEQLEGKIADPRTDLWALGTILYEMVTGQRAFEGASAVSLIGAIMNAEPPALTGRQPLTPPALERLVRKCLAKNPDQRWDTAHDLADELRWISQTGATAAGAAPSLRRRRGLRTTILVASILVAAMIGAGVTWLLRPISPRAPLAGLSLNVLPAEDVNAGGVSPSTVRTPGGSRTALTWTPDGRALVFVGRRGGVQQLYVRRLDSAEARPLPNTDGAQAPAVSADGQWVAFWADGSIRKVPLGGGPTMDLASDIASPPWGLAWDTDGRLFFGGDDGRIWTITADRAPAAVTTVGEAELRHVLPSPLPGGRVLLYTVRKRQWSWGDEEVVAQTLATGVRTVLLRDAADARYVPTGHLLFMRRGVLFAVPFDPEGLRVVGKEVPVLDTVAQALTSTTGYDVTGAGQFAVAPTGTLAWIPGPPATYPDATLVTVDRKGQISPIPAPARSYGSGMRLSPDGRRLAVLIFGLAERGLWVYDMGRGTLTPLALGGEAHGPVWSPDGQRLVFNWLAAGRPALASQPADGTAPPEVLVGRRQLFPSSFTPDGRHLAAATMWDIVIVTISR